jgi:hypothetical protein
VAQVLLGKRGEHHRLRLRYGRRGAPGLLPAHQPDCHKRIKGGTAAEMTRYGK